MADRVISGSDTGFMLISAGLVQLMTPGLAFFYAGLVRQKNVVTMIAQNFVSMGITTILWVFILFSLCFAEDWGSSGVVGNPMTFIGFRHMSIKEPLSGGSSGGVTAAIPGVLFGFYQCMFAVISPALMTGAFADRLRYAPWVVFLSFWLLLVYVPWCHMIWGGGVLAQMKVQDFAGGIVVHTTAGFSALACILMLGRRGDLDQDSEALATPHNVPLVFLGTALLWFGWFGFNAGSALSAGPLAVLAGWNSQVAAAAAMTVWTGIDWVVRGKPGLMSKCIGAIAGLATVTPCAGFVQPSCALVLGMLSAPVCYACVALLDCLGFDDALDVWGVHGMGGVLGSILLGVLADGPECANVETAPSYCVNPGTVTASWEQLGLQTGAVLACAVYSFVVSYILLVVIGHWIELTPSAQEQRNLDAVLHGEQAYTRMNTIERAKTFQRQKSFLREPLVWHDAEEA
mmetsp:Transcript_59991/g.135278  ORF Transcript_59991/g.135278 Transcript_59991/m.135278 type:complete len:459 (+) Transcript_59991:75-1451(+)